MFVNFNILNQLGSPAINSNTFANRPAAGQTGRLFVSTDTFEIYRDNGTTWDLIGGPGSSTITGTGTATQVAYFTSSQAIGSDSNLFWDNANIRLGIGTSSPGARLDIHGSGVVGQFNGTTSASNIYLAFQRGGVNLWRVGDMYNSGQNFFEIRNSVLSNNAVEISAATNKTTFLANESYSSGQAQGNLFTYNLTVPANATFTSPNAVSAVNAFINLSLGGSATMPAGTRQGIEGNSRLSFTGAGTLTMTQGSTLRAYAAITGVHSFAGSAVGTITHLAGLRLCFPDNVGSDINITNNYALLINNQATGSGVVNYTNRWGIYQEGAFDLNYFASNLMLGSTINSGERLQVTGTSLFTGLSTFTNNEAIRINPASGAAYLNFRIATTSYSLIGIAGASNDIIAGSILGDLNIRATNSQNILFSTNNGATAAAILNSSGNLGLGVTPSAWSVTGKVFEFGGGGGSASLFDNGINDTWYSSNTYFNGSSWIYKGNGTATQYYQGNGHKWYLAPSGTAGNAITFTQAMTLTAAGNLGIGTTSPDSYYSAADNLVVGTTSGSNGITIATGTTGVGALYFADGTTGNELYRGYFEYFHSTDALAFGTAGGERARITSGGNVLIGTTTDAGQKLQVNGTARASEFNSTSGSVSVPVSTATTFFTPTTTGLYMAHIYLGGSPTQTWSAVIIFAFQATNVLIVNQTNGVNVSTSVSGTNIQVTQIGAITYTFFYEIIKIA